MPNTFKSIIKISIVIALISAVFLFAPQARGQEKTSAQEKSSPTPSPTSSPIFEPPRTPGENEDSSVGTTPTPTPTPSEVLDPFKEARPVKFDFKESNIKKIKITSCGKLFEFEGYQVKPGEILIPLSTKNTDKLLANFGTTARYDKETRQVIFTRRDKRAMRMKIDYNVVDHAGTKKEIPVPPRIIEGMVHISPNSFSRFLWSCFLYNEEKELYYMDPFVLDVYLHTTDEGLTKVVAKGTGPLEHRILKLRKPTRFVIDIMNSCLDGKAREIDHPSLGAIRFSQHELMGEDGNIVRIVIPESENIEVALAKTWSKRYVEAELRPRRSSAPVQNLAVQKVENLEVRETKNLVTIIMETTGSIQLEWNRLLPPDDRFFVDIPGTIFPARKKKFSLKNDFLPVVKVAQFQPQPDPIVRMVMPLEGPRKVTIKSDPDDPNRVKFYIAREKIDSKTAARRGFFITYYPSRGLVICLDPGHGGSDPGAVNHKKNLLEKDLTLDIARRLKKKLVRDGWTVVMTRNSDRDVTYAGSPDYEELGARTSIANDLRADIFISLHINSSIRPQVCGFSTYWYKKSDKKLASMIQNSMVAALDCRDLGIRKDRFFVLHRTRMPAVLVESGFISNDDEADNLKNPAYRQKIADAIIQGLRAYAKTMKLNKNKNKVENKAKKKR